MVILKIKGYVTSNLPETLLKKDRSRKFFVVDKYTAVIADIGKQYQVLNFNRNGKLKTKTILCDGECSPHKVWTSLFDKYLVSLHREEGKNSKSSHESCCVVNTHNATIKKVKISSKEQTVSFIAAQQGILIVKESHILIIPNYTKLNEIDFLRLNIPLNTCNRRAFLALEKTRVLLSTHHHINEVILTSGSCSKYTHPKSRAFNCYIAFNRYIVAASASRLIVWVVDTEVNNNDNISNSYYNNNHTNANDEITNGNDYNTPEGAQEGKPKVSMYQAYSIMISTVERKLVAPSLHMLNGNNLHSVWVTDVAGTITLYSLPHLNILIKYKLSQLQRVNNKEHNNNDTTNTNNSKNNNNYANTNNSKNKSNSNNRTRVIKMNSDTSIPERDAKNKDSGLSNCNKKSNHKEENENTKGKIRTKRLSFGKLYVHVDNMNIKFTLAFRNKFHRSHKKESQETTNSSSRSSTFSASSFPTDSYIQEEIIEQEPKNIETTQIRISSTNAHQQLECNSNPTLENIHFSKNSEQGSSSPEILEYLNEGSESLKSSNLTLSVSPRGSHGTISRSLSEVCLVSNSRSREKDNDRNLDELGARPYVPGRKSSKSGHKENSIVIANNNNRSGNTFLQQILDSKNLIQHISYYPNNDTNSNDNGETDAPYLVVCLPKILWFFPTATATASTTNTTTTAATGATDTTASTAPIKKNYTNPDENPNQHNYTGFRDIDGRELNRVGFAISKGRASHFKVFGETLCYKLSSKASQQFIRWTPTMTYLKKKVPSF